MPRGRAETVDSLRRVAAGLVVVALPEAFLGRHVQLVIGRDQSAARVEQQRPVEPAPGRRIPQDHAAQHADVRIPRRGCQGAVAGPFWLLGVLRPSGSRGRRPGVQRQLGQDCQLGAELARLAQPGGKALGPVAFVKRLVHERYRQRGHSSIPRCCSPHSAVSTRAP
jgi:hypothetical protein